MSNLFLPSPFDERIRRLALGLEPLDFARGGRVIHPIQILVERPSPGLPRPLMVRHLSGLFVLCHDPAVPTVLEMRICDLGEPTDPPGYRPETNRRRLVPRRLRIEIPTPELADSLPIERRARRPVLFPGAAYEITDSVTGIRARVVQGDTPVRWARVQARRPGAAPADPPVGRAHGDDRGEFLMLIEPAAAPMAALEDPFELDLVVYAPLAPLPLPPQSVRDSDGLWDLPVESLSLSGSPDPVAEGAFPPPGWGPGSPPTRIALTYGRLLAGGLTLNL